MILAKLYYFTNLDFPGIRGPVSLPKCYLLGAQTRAKWTAAAFANTWFRETVNRFASHDCVLYRGNLGVSKNMGKPPKSSILTGLSIINHSFWGTPIFGNTHLLSIDTPPRSLTARPLKNDGLKMNFLLGRPIFGVYVKLPGSTNCC